MLLKLRNKEKSNRNILMIENKIEYKILEFILNRKLNLYFSIVLLILSFLLFDNSENVFSGLFFFSIPILMFYELILLLYDYSNRNKLIFHSLIFLFILIFIFNLFFRFNVFFVMGCFLFFIYRSYKSTRMFFLNSENRFHLIYLQIIFSPFLIHKQKEIIFKLIKERDYKNQD